MEESYPDGYKILWEKEKSLVTSNFSFSHSVFKRFVSRRRQKVSLCGNGLSEVQEIPVSFELFTTQSRLSTTLRKRPFENIVGRGEKAGNQHFLLFAQCFLPYQTDEQFLLFQQCFLPFLRTFCHFHQI